MKRTLLPKTKPRMKRVRAVRPMNLPDRKEMKAIHDAHILKQFNLAIVDVVKQQQKLHAALRYLQVFADMLAPPEKDCPTKTSNGK